MTMELDFREIELRAAANGWSLWELQKVAGLSGNTLYRLKRGQTRPSAKTIGKVCHALQCGPADILKTPNKEG